MLHLPNNKSFAVIQKFLKDNEALVYWYMTLSISRAIKHNTDKTELFSFGGNGENIAIVKQKDYEQVLSDAIKHFSKVEEYERAAFARDLLQKWKIEQLLNENKHQE
jgi:histone acetyltransferase (RNA polymerase elongator complex component)